MLYVPKYDGFCYIESFPNESDTSSIIYYSVIQFTQDHQEHKMWMKPYGGALDFLYIKSVIRRAYKVIKINI